MCERLDTIILCTFIKNEQVHLLMMGLTIIAYAWKKEKEKWASTKKPKFLEVSLSATNIGRKEDEWSQNIKEV